MAYTASIALSDGGFNNWDWGQFGQSVAIGAVSGAVTFGIGTGFDNLGTAAVEAGKTSKLAMIEAGRLATHATFQGGLSAAQGGDFWIAFASGAVGGAIGLGTENWESNFSNNAVIMGSAMLLGGATAELKGGEFWKGAAISGIVVGANHLAHKIGATFEEEIGEDYLEEEASGPGPLGQKYLPKRSNYPEGTFGDMMYELDLMLFQSSFFPTLGTVGMGPQLVRNITGRHVTKATIQLVRNLGRNRVHHILQKHHAWSKVISNPNWRKVSGIIAETLDKGVPFPYKGVYSKIMYYKGHHVQVVFNYLDDGTVAISDAWVLTR